MNHYIHLVLKYILGVERFNNNGYKQAIYIIVEVSN
jgi:hypothetical protein